MPSSGSRRPDCLKTTIGLLNQVTHSGTTLARLGWSRSPGVGMRVSIGRVQVLLLLLVLAVAAQTASVAGRRSDPSFSGAVLTGFGVVRSIAVGDLNADGLADIAGGLTDGSGIRVAFGAGYGGFSGAITQATTRPVVDVRIADMTGDGLAELVTAEVASSSSSAVNVWTVDSSSITLWSSLAGTTDIRNLQVGDMDSGI